MGGSREDVKWFPETAQDSLGFELYRIQCGLDPKLSDAHFAMATILSLEWNWKAAEAEINQALALDPGRSRMAIRSTLWTVAA